MLPRQFRLTKDRDFSRIYKNSRKFSGQALSIRILRNNLAVSRFGFVVANKSLSKAVARNLAKRKIRAAVEENINNVKPGFDVIIKLERPDLNTDFKSEVEFLLKRNNLLHDQKADIKTD